MAWCATPHGGHDMHLVVCKCCAHVTAYQLVGSSAILVYVAASIVVGPMAGRADTAEKLHRFAAVGVCEVHVTGAAFHFM